MSGSNIEKRQLRKALTSQSVGGLRVDAPDYPRYGNRGMDKSDYVALAKGIYGKTELPPYRLRYMGSGNDILPYNSNRDSKTQPYFRHSLDETKPLPLFPWAQATGLPLRLMNLIDELGPREAVFFEAPLPEEVARFEAEGLIDWVGYNLPNHWRANPGDLLAMGFNDSQNPDPGVLNASDYFLSANPRYNGLCPLGFYHICDSTSTTSCRNQNLCSTIPNTLDKLWAHGISCGLKARFKNYSVSGVQGWNADICRPIAINPIWHGETETEHAERARKSNSALTWRERASRRKDPDNVMGTFHKSIGVRPDDLHPVGTTIWLVNDEEKVDTLPSTLISWQYTRPIEKWSKFSLSTSKHDDDNEEKLVVYRADPQQFTDSDGNTWVALGDVIERFRKPDVIPDQPGLVPGYNIADKSGKTHPTDHTVYPKPLVRAVYVNSQFLSEIPLSSSLVGNGMGGPSATLVAREKKYDIWRNNATNTGYVVGEGQIPQVKWYIPVTPEQRLACCQGKLSNNLLCGSNAPQSANCDELVSGMCSAVSQSEDKQLYADWIGPKQNWFCSCFQPVSATDEKGQPVSEIEQLLRQARTCVGRCASDGYKTAAMLQTKCPNLCLNLTNLTAGKNINIASGVKFEATNNCPLSLNEKNITTPTLKEGAAASVREVAANTAEKNSSTKKLSDGEIAGIAVGAIAAVALIFGGIAGGVLASKPKPAA